jgi:hypothetical protein
MSADSKVPQKYRNPLSTDWGCYKTELVSGFGDILTEDDTENSVNVLQSKIIAAYEKACPLKRVRLNQSTPSWSFDLAGLHRVGRWAWNNRSSNPEAYGKALKEYDRVLRRKHRSSRRDFCSNVEVMKPIARLHKILAKDESYQIGGLRLPSGDFTASDQEVEDHLLETHFPDFQPIMENTARAIPLRTPTEEDWLVASERVWFKSAGEDGIFLALLKNEIEILSGPLVKIFIACLALGYIPEAWQRVRVIFISKPVSTL